VRGRVGSPKIGIFAEGSHRVVDIPRCEIHHPLINTVSLALRAAMRELKVTAYSDAAHMGLVRGVQIAVERSSQTAQVVLICNSTSPDAASPLLDALQQKLGPTLHSLWWNAQPEQTNRVLGSTFQRVSGPECVVENLGGARVFFPPGAFGQNNLDLFDAMLEQIHGWVPHNCRLVELYAGCGAIGLGLVQRAEAVTFNELGEASLAGLERGLSALPAAEQARVRVVRGPAELAAQEIDKGNVVIVDPPKKGLGPEVLAALQARPPERLIYVSCGIDSFLRDAEALVALGLRFESATVYDLFPYTRHIETLACFSRLGAGEREGT
jgi:23S rRNA (uracil1939-C5)-methyltransferase